MILCVSAIPRPGGTSYTEQTVSQLLRDGGMPDIAVLVVDDIAKTGSGPALHRLFKLCHESYPGEAALFIEDDIQCSKNALLAAARFVDNMPDGCEMLTFFNNRLRFLPAPYGCVDVDHVDVTYSRMCGNMPPVAGVYMAPATKPFTYSQACLLSGKYIEHVAKSEWPSAVSTEDVYKAYKAGRPIMDAFAVTPGELNFMAPDCIRDQAMGWLASQISERIGIVVPNWFQHIGDVSSVLAEAEDPTNRARYVKAGNFISLEHDALEDDVSCIYERPY